MNSFFLSLGRLQEPEALVVAGLSGAAAFDRDRLAVADLDARHADVLEGEAVVAARVLADADAEDADRVVEDLVHVAGGRRERDRAARAGPRVAEHARR